MKTEHKELRTVGFHRSQMLKRPQPEDLLAMKDADEHKLPGMNTLLLQMHRLHSELKAVGLHLRKDEKDRYPRENLFLLTDTEYEDWPRFEIKLKSDWLNPNHPIALHGNFRFKLYVWQDGYEGRHEVADWINIEIAHLNTTPFSFASHREHVRALGMFYRQGGSYFDDIPMKSAATVSFDRLASGMNFKTAAFNQAVNDACKVMDKVIARKGFLKILEKS